MSFKKLEETNWNTKTCKHPEHNPPSHIVLDPGNYEYTCPACLKTTIITIPILLVEKIITS